MIRAAVVRFCGLNIDKAMRKDRASDKAKRTKIKRKSKQTTGPWVPFLRVLRHVDKCSGAAGAAAADGGDGRAGSSSASAGGRASPSDSDEKDNGLPAAGAFQSRPRGSKAAKQEMSEDIRASRPLKDSSEALLALARATMERITVAFFDTAEMRGTPEAIVFSKMHSRKLMAATRTDFFSSPPAMTSGPAGTVAALATDARSSTAPTAVSEVHPPPPVSKKPAAVAYEVHARSSTASAAVSEVYPPPPIGKKPAAVLSEVQSQPASRKQHASGACDVSSCSQDDRPRHAKPWRPVPGAEAGEGGGGPCCRVDYNRRRR